ncbi:hypothetical protein [Bacillus chungangensis]|uniref:Transposase n=1 Tax=Bacillus chungangensis TaxID=587633 RepID=A0ABT9WMB3_9BACI|nr:hypothetical protein [Bacillus chungangensis]MDQ0174381.1 hypothetical protein [Bacillus chungangensis]
MAIVPLKQIVTVHRVVEKNKWGEEKTTSNEMKCRIDERTQIVKNVAGEEVVSGAEMWFDKFPDVRYDDAFEYTDERGITTKARPIKIEPVRMLSGKPTLTIVYV